MAAMWMVAMLACCGAASGQSWLANISLNLRTEMQGVLEMAVVNYSQPDINTTYVASVEFDMRAMGPLYNSSHLVIDFIADKQAYPADFVKVSGGHIDIESPREKWRELLAHYAGPVGVVVVAALLVVALPLAGLLWCCCYWCRGGRRRRPFDRKYDVCLKGILAILLIGLITLFLFGVVCAFATDSQLEDGLRGAGGAVQRGSRDARAFLNATQAHARHLLVHNYGELERRLQAILTSSGLTVSLQLGEFSRGASLGALQRVVARLDGVAARLQAVRLLTARLRRHAENLNTGLRKVRSHLLQTLATCAQPDCVRLQEKYSIGQLDTDIQYSQIPDVTELLANVTAILNSTIKEDVAEGQKVFKNIQLGIQRSVDEHIPSVQDAITQTGHKLRSVADEITAAAGNASARLERVHAGEAIDSLHRQYGAYRRHAGRAVAAALLLITCLLVWGLTCGVCGKRPDQYYTHDCCNKGSGARGLLCAMGVMFVVGGAAALALLVYFVCGVAAQRFLCEPLTEPRNNRLFDDLEQLVEFEQLMFNERRDADFNMSAVLIRCHSNMTIYETLSLHRLYDLPSLRAQAGAALAERVARVRVALPARAPVRLLAGRARARLRALQAAGLEHFRGDALLQALETNMTKLDLEGLIEQTSKAAHNVSLKEGYERVGAALQQAAQQLRRQETDSLQPLRADTRELQRIATELQDELRFNQSSMKDAIDYLLHETQQAESFLNTQGAALVQNITLDLGEVVASMLGDYLDMVVRAAREDVGRCGPLSNAFNATRDAACQQILMPANGYWISLAWCLVLLAPLLALAPRLAALYRRPEPYPGPLVEAEYLYDAYADRDNVPLANAYKAEKRSGGGRGAARRGGGAGSGAGGGAGRSAEVAPPVDAHHARRYNDMAPKHWEEGPPRYHGPTEYERPPPYYYPGPADRQ